MIRLTAFPILLQKQDLKFKNFLIKLSNTGRVDEERVCKDFFFFKDFSEIPEYVKRYSQKFLEYVNNVYVKQDSLLKIEENVLLNEYMTEEEKIKIYKIIKSLREYTFFFNDIGRHVLFPQVVLSSDKRRIFVYPYHTTKTSILYGILKNILELKEGRYVLVEYDMISAIPRMYIYTYLQDTEFIDCFNCDDTYDCIHKVFYEKSLQTEKDRNTFKRKILAFIHSGKVELFKNYENYNDKVKRFCSPILKSLEEGYYENLIDKIYFSVNEYVLDFIDSVNGIIVYPNFDGGLMFIQEDLSNHQDKIRF